MAALVDNAMISLLFLGINRPFYFTNLFRTSTISIFCPRKYHIKCKTSRIDVKEPTSCYSVINPVQVARNVSATFVTFKSLGYCTKHNETYPLTPIALNTSATRLFVLLDLCLPDIEMVSTTYICAWSHTRSSPWIAYTWNLEVVEAEMYDFDWRFLAIVAASMGCVRRLYYLANPKSYTGDLCGRTSYASHLSTS